MNLVAKMSDPITYYDLVEPREAFSRSMRDHKSRADARISGDSLKCAEMEGLDGGEGGFEPPRPFGIRCAEFVPNLAHYSAREKASVLQRICSPGVRLFFGSLRSPFARYADARSL